ncbi:unnamed protein product [Protopolystoma xenopodis]|uniref:Uncharacterized protein n=1 Tax=Protopolystoma xenopodis TaxID=117903 RepID=A0A448WWY9_9PLAT|nr:unnamed protein product [Protopolystoma xenopodis]
MKQTGISCSQQEGEMKEEHSLLRLQAMVIAKRHRMLSIIELLLRRGAHPDASIQPLPSLILAVQHADVHLSRALLAAGADPNRPVVEVNATGPKLQVWKL